MNKIFKLSVTILVIIILVAAVFYKYKKDPVLGYQVINVFPHDTSSWCQGLEMNDGYFYEGTGRKKGLAKLKKVEITTGDVLKFIELDKKYFGEGITILNDKIYQLTYKAGEAFVYDKKTLNLIETFTYPTEGWGLTNDGKNLIMSDGSEIIRYLNPDNFEVIREFKVKNNGFGVKKLNELEYVDGEIYANILSSDYIVRINADTGKITGWINLKGILSNEDRKKYDVDVMNCIALNMVNDNLFITGKLWPKVFEIKLENKT